MSIDPENNVGSAPGGTGTKPEAPNLGGRDTGNMPESIDFDKLALREFSYYWDGYAKESTVVMSLGELLAETRGGKWRAQVEGLRDILTGGDKETYDIKKKSLPTVTMSGVIAGQRKGAPGDDRQKHSGLLQIDLDGKDHPTLTTSEILEVCKSSPHVIAAWVSPSGEGVKAVVPIESEVSSHLCSFLAAEIQFGELGLKIDPSTKDPARLMFVSYDPDLWINPDGAVVLMPLKAAGTMAGDPSATKKARGKHDKTRSADEIRFILSFILTRPSYSDWTMISWAVFSCLPISDAIDLLKEWSPEEKPGEYDELAKGWKKGKEVTFGTLIHFAKQHGYVPTPDIPDDVLPLPSGGIGNRRAAVAVFSHLASTGKVFMRGETVCEVVIDRRAHATIMIISPERLVELVETVGKRVAERQAILIDRSDPKSGKRTVWRTRTMPVSVAKILLATIAAREELPPLRQLIASPIIVETEDGGAEILRKGYHHFGGGTYITSDLELETVPGGYFIAVELLLNLLGDFHFASQADKSRAIASFISPALKMGGFIEGDFPLDVAEADQSQSGKTYRQKIIATLYGETPSVITSRKGGVGSLDESVANALILGRTFIALDNIRGVIDTPLLEAALRGHGQANCRGFRACQSIDVTPFLWQLSTNGAELTRDLANRSIITRIRKQPNGYRFKDYREGDLLAHVKGRRALYLSAVFEVVKEWVARGKPKTQESQHDFREWTRSLDWIVQHLFKLPPLMDGHRMEQDRTSNPKLQWLRDICLAAQPEHFGCGLTATQIVGIADDAGIDIPSASFSREKPVMIVGKILGGLFRRAASEELKIDGFILRRSTGGTTAFGEGTTKKSYFLQRIDAS